VQRTPPGRAPAAIFAAVLALNFLLVPVRHNAFAWGGLTRDPDTDLAAFLTSDAFVAGATYRVLAASDAKYSMYDTVRHGGRLDSEFFPESMLRRSWPDSASYAALLQRRGVDYVIITPGYDQGYRTNEHVLLESLSNTPADTGNHTFLQTTRIAHEHDYDVYRIREYLLTP
jgi:hypothetical protein